MIDRVENYLRQWRRRLSPSEWLANRLGLPVSEAPGTEPGMLLIQIDGFARRQLEMAIKRGRMPFLRSLMRRESYELHTFYSGIPSGTPAVQGELFYGVKCGVPAFSFLDRHSKRMASMSRPHWVKIVESRLRSAGGPGLLEGGSSWGNMYSGGATMEETHFCAASFGWGDMLRSASVLGFLGIMLMQIPAVLRAMALLIVEFFLAIGDFFRGMTHGGILFYEFRFIFARVLLVLAMREFVTLGARIDLARGVPILHVNFLGYDEQAHHRGPSSLFAHWTLKGIDRAVQTLYRAAHRSHRRDYVVWIFSDHGQENCRSYDKTFPEGLEASIRKVLDKMARDSHSGRPQRGTRRISRAYWAGGPRSVRHLERHAHFELLSPEEESSFTHTAQGPVGHLYFAGGLADKAKQEIAEALVKRAHLPGILYKTGPESAVWIHAKGTVRLPEEGASVLPHPGRLREEVARDLVRLAHNEHSGELIALGWNPAGPPHWTFPVERGAHGGPGSDETQGFVLLPPGVCLPRTAGEFIRPLDLRAAVLHVLRRRRIATHDRIIVPRTARQLRIMTYNVHSCVGMDGRCSPHRVARVIENHHADIIALQEIDLGRARSRWHDQARMIADELGLNVSFCPTVVREKELYGHAILSRFPMTVARVGLLSAGPLALRLEPRGALWVKVEVEGVPVHFMNTHFGLARFEQTAQAADILSKNWMGSIGMDEPLIVCGDFNMPPGSVPYRALTNRLRDVQTTLGNFRPLKTFAAAYPFTRIDHIFVSPHFEVERVRVPRNHLTRIASDHLPLMVDLALKKKSAPVLT